MPAKVKKLKARPKRTILDEADDHPLGLWVDKELIRRHTQQLPTPRTIIHGASDNSRRPEPLFTEALRPPATVIWSWLISLWAITRRSRRRTGKQPR